MKLRDRAIFIALLENAAMSERELARQAGLSHATVNHLVTGRRSTCTVSTALAITDVFGCAVGALFMVQRRDEQLVIDARERTAKPHRRK